MIDPSAQFELQVLPNGRSAADEYLHQGAIWIEGREGSRYVLKFTNRSFSRVNVVFSVDGLDTVDGRPAGPSSQGYIVNPVSNIEIPGWLLDNHTAAEFYFARAGKSYVAASGNNTANTGVIGAMVFKEQSQYLYIVNSPTIQSSGWYPGATSTISGQTAWTPGQWQTAWTPRQWYESKSTNDVFTAICGNAAASSMPQSVLAQEQPVERRVSINPQVAATTQDVGTGFGNATEFTTVATQFVRANSNHPDAILAIYYNSLQNLQKMGIQVKTVRNNYATSNSANPFPTYSPGCVPPADWKP